MSAVNPPFKNSLKGYNVTCSKCGKSFSSSRDYLTHVQTGYPCGPVAR